MQRAEEKIGRLTTLIVGDGSSLGLAARMEIVWRSYVWLIGLLGMAVGFFLARMVP